MPFQKSSIKFIVCLLVLLGIAFNAQAVVYVNANATGANNGTSWTDAYKDLQSAIAGWDDIWVAKGTYKPTTGSDRTISFQLKPYARIYGHFAGNETEVSQRVLTNLENTTILSGDIGVIGDSSDNSYHVVYADGTTAAGNITNYNTLLDGFTITGGNANGTAPHDSGGGLYCDGAGESKECSPTLNNIIFLGNTTNGYGGAMYNIGGGIDSVSNPVLTNVTFSNNSASSGGAMYICSRCSTILTNVKFIGNSASNRGGAIYNYGRDNSPSNSVLKNVTFSNNHSSYGGAICNFGLNGYFNPSFTDVFFTNNSAGLGGAVYSNINTGNDSSAFINVIFSGNSATESGGAIHNYAYDYATISHTFTNVIFSGNSASSGGAIYNQSELASYINPILTNVTFSGNSAVNNGGAFYNYAYFYGHCNPVLKNVILWGNSAANGSQIYNDASTVKISSVTPNISYCLIQGGIAGIFNNGNASVTDGGGNIEADPLFINPVQASSAPTTAGDYHLRSASPAIDAGNNAAVYGIANDPDGNPRVSGSSADMGAYELPFYTVRFKVSPADGGTVSVSSQLIPSGGQTWPVTAIPAGGYKFVNWTGADGFVTTTNNPLTVANVTSSMTITANFQMTRYNKAIIIAGGYYSTNDIWDATRINTELAYNALESKGYAPENIYYLSSDKNFISPVDGFASKKNLQDAVSTWAYDADNLLIYMISHGGTGTFKINETETLYAWELDGWLDNIQQTIPGNVILIYDACMSGSFIEPLIPPTGKKRIIVTSASAEENAIIAQEGIFTFSWFFWPQISVGRPFYDSFINTRNAIEVLRDSLITRQHPQIDADGNGKGNEEPDIEIAINTKLPRETYGFPTIGSVSPDQTLTDTTSALIYAENVTDADGIKRVWAAVIRAEAVSCYSADTPITYLPIIELKPAGNNRYETTYTGFTSKGIYKFAVFATDNRGFTSLLEQKHVTYVTQTQDFSAFARKGDLNGDSQTNLADVILALQVLSGLKPSQSRCDYAASGADVNGDNRVGLQEVIYILQVVAGLR